MMIRQVTQINWRYVGDVVPSFVVLTFIPFSYSVAYGLIAYVPDFLIKQPRLTFIKRRLCLRRSQWFRWTHRHFIRRAH